MILPTLPLAPQSMLAHESRVLLPQSRVLPARRLNLRALLAPFGLATQKLVERPFLGNVRLLRTARAHTTLTVQPHADGTALRAHRPHP